MRQTKELHREKSIRGAKKNFRFLTQGAAMG
jgi:hypothetical protein